MELAKHVVLVISAPTVVSKGVDEKMFGHYNQGNLGVNLGRFGLELLFVLLILTQSDAVWP